HQSSWSAPTTTAGSPPPKIQKPSPPPCAKSTSLTTASRTPAAVPASSPAPTPPKFGPSASSRCAANSLILDHRPNDLLRIILPIKPDRPPNLLQLRHPPHHVVKLLPVRLF